MTTELLRVNVISDSADKYVAYVDVSGPVIVEEAGRARAGCSILRTQVGTLIVEEEPRELNIIIRQHRGVR